MSRMRKKFQRKKCFQQTLQTVPQEKRARLSLACGRKFFTEFMLNNHIAKSHTNVKCDICDKTVTKKGLSKHIQTHQDITFECEMCDNVYNRTRQVGKA